MTVQRGERERQTDATTTPTFWTGTCWRDCGNEHVTRAAWRRVDPKPSTTMQRIFGTSNRAPKATISDAISGVWYYFFQSKDLPAFILINGLTRQNETRIASIEVKIKKLDGELQRFKEQLSKLKTGHARVRWLSLNPNHFVLCLLLLWRPRCQMQQRGFALVPFLDITELTSPSPPLPLHSLTHP